MPKEGGTYQRRERRYHVDRGLRAPTVYVYVRDRQPRSLGQLLYRLRRLVTHRRAGAAAAVQPEQP